MPGPKKKYPFAGREVMGQELDFEVEGERFNSYILEDGTKIRLKAVVATIVRLDEYLPNGEPVYLVNASNVLAADVPDKLKRQE